jgi:hypothetical protein
MKPSTDAAYLDLLGQISDTYTQGRIRAVQAVNSHITQTYWQVGRQIVSWSVVVELLKIDDPLERSFYEQKTLREAGASAE